MKVLASAMFAAAILVFGADGLGQAWAAPAAAHVKVRAWGQPRSGGGGPRGGWGAGYAWRGYGWRGYGGSGFYAWGPRPWWGPAWYGYPAYPYTYYPYTYYPYAYPPAVVVQPNPQTYIQQAPPAIQQGPPATGQPQPPNYWYYCADSKSYYPYVRECPEGWMTVVPPSSSPSP